MPLSQSSSNLSGPTIMLCQRAPEGVCAEGGAPPLGGGGGLRCHRPMRIERFYMGVTHSTRPRRGVTDACERRSRDSVVIRTVQQWF